MAGGFIVLEDVECKSKFGAFSWQVCTPDGNCRTARVSELFVYDNFIRVPVDSVAAGDICALSGLDDVMVRALYPSAGPSPQ